MAFTSFVLLTLLSQVPVQASSGAMVRASGHTYGLFCSQEGELIRASETGLCEKTESGGVKRFEIRDETGEVQFFQDAPAGNPLSYVGIFSVANAGREILYVDTSHEEIHGSGPNPAHLSTGIALSRTFNTGFFQFSVLLDFNVANHHIEIMPDQIAFPAFPPPGRQKSGPSPAAGEIKIYSSHESGAPKTDIKIAPGHVVKWWQSLDPGEKLVAGQVVKILAAWAPASLKPADNAPEGVRMVYYDWNNLWLQIQVDDHTGWIKGTSSFRVIGLEMANAQR